MRISDWSSDVCSSDLDVGAEGVVRLRHVGVIALQLDVAVRIGVDRVLDADVVIIDRDRQSRREARREHGAERERVGGFLLEVEIAAVGAVEVVARLRIFLRRAVGRLLREQRLDAGVEPATRSEEHTSELQSLMRISYAVFCLKKKKYQKQ